MDRLKGGDYLVKRIVKQKFITTCGYCGEEKVGKAGKYHKWCSDLARTEMTKMYAKTK